MSIFSIKKSEGIPRIFQRFSFSFRIAVAFRVLEFEKPGEFLIFCSQNIGDKAGNERRNREQKIDPPKRIERGFGGNVVGKNAGVHSSDQNGDDNSETGKEAINDEMANAIVASQPLRGVISFGIMSPEEMRAEIAKYSD